MDDRKNLIHFIFNKVSFAFVVIALSANAFSETFQLGDLAPRGAPDGLLNAGDSLLLQRMVLGDIVPTSDEILIGDVAPLGAPDGVLNTGDLVVQQRAVLGLVSLGIIDIVTLPKPVLYAGVSPTNDNPYLISGTASSNATVDIYVNGTLQQQPNSDAVGNFSINVYLSDGLNSIYAIEVNGVDTSPASNILQVQYDNIIDRNNLPANISVNTVWTPGSTPSPYIISENLTIDAGVYLIIQPGTEVKFELGVKLYVVGNLSVKGTANDLVVFTSNKAQIDKKRKDWQGLHVKGNSSMLNINYAKIEYATEGIYFDLDSNGVVKKSIIENNNIGIYVTSANDVNVTDSIIKYNGAGFYILSGMYPEIGKASFIGPNNIITSNTSGLYFKIPSVVYAAGFVNPEAIIRGNKIYDNTYDVSTEDLKSGYIGNNVYGVLLDLQGNYWGSVNYGEIVANMRSDGYYRNPTVIYDVTGYLDSNGVADTAIAMFGSLEEFVTFNGTGPLIKNVDYLALTTLVVDSNTSIIIPEGVSIQFSNTVLNAVGNPVIEQGIEVYGTLNVVGAINNSVILTSNKDSIDRAAGDWNGITVKDNGIVTIDNADIEYASSGVSFGFGSDGSVTNSKIINNLIAIAAFGDGANESNNPQPVVTGNSIYNNVNENYYTSYYVGASNVVLNAVNNWWGTTNNSEIKHKIHDWNNDTTNKVVVDYSNYLASEGGNIFVEYELPVCPIVRVTDDSDFADKYPVDDISWTGANYTDVKEVEAAFNYARAIDNTVFQYLKMPSQTEWDAMSVQSQGLYLINSERQSRGIKPYEGISQYVVAVAQGYSDFLRTNNLPIGHYQDGKSPLIRLNEDVVVSVNSETGAYPESIYGQFGSNPIGSDKEVVVDAIYRWIYADKSGGNNWGHRDHIIQTGLNENSGETYKEGLIGFGISTGDYDPTLSAPGNVGAVVVLNSIDPSSGWDQSTTQSVDTDTAQLCNDIINIEIDQTPIPVNQIKSLEISPSSVYLSQGSTADLQVTAAYLDGSKQDITSLARFIADNLSIVNIDAGTVTGNKVGYVYASATINDVRSNNILITVGEATDLTNLNDTPAQYLAEHVPVNATVQTYDPKAMGIFTGEVFDKTGTGMPDVSISIHNKPEYGSVLTDINGRFIIATGAGEQRLVYSKSGHLTIHRTGSAASNNWSVLDEVTLLPVDTAETDIDLTAGSPQVHKSSVITDAFGSRSTTLVFNGISTATVSGIDGTSRALTNFSVRATEYELPNSMPADLPKESAFTYCSELQIPGVRDDETVTFDKPVVMYVDNFLGFNVGEIVPIGYYDRQIGDWIASDNGVVVKLLDTNSDGSVDGLDFDGDNIADDFNQNGSTVDEAVGIENYTVGSTYWRGSFDHFTPWDFNWPYTPPGDATDRGEFDPESSKEDKKQDEKTCTGSYVKPETQAFHEDIPITGTDLTLHYSSQRTEDYKHKFNVQVSGDSVPDSMLEMVVKLEIGGNIFTKIFSPSINTEAEFIWDGKDLSGKHIKGVVHGLISIGYKYNTNYSSAGIVILPVDPVSFKSKWAKVGTNITNVPGRNEFISWSSSPIVVHNTFDHQIADGWSLSNHHLYSTTGNIYKGDGEVIDADKSSIVLRTGIKISRYDGDDGFYQKGGKDIDYEIITSTTDVQDNGATFAIASVENSTLKDKVTGLEWQYIENPQKYTLFSKAYNYCSSADFTSDIEGWRLPTKKEVVYTIDKSDGIQNYYIYTLEAVDNIWYPGNNNPDDKLLPVICVRGEKLNSRYVVDLKRNDTLEVVVDGQTDLMWQDDISTTSITKNWTDAIDYCETEMDGFAGYSDWRLPNINELTYALPNTIFVNQTVYPSNQFWGPSSPDRNPYWSSTPYVSFENYSWAMESAGYTSPVFKNSDLNHVRCVRGNSQAAKSPYRFDEVGKHIETIDIDSRVVLTTFNYDDNDRLISMTDRFGDTVTIARNGLSGKVLSIRSEDGYVTRLTISTNGVLDDQSNQLTQAIYDDGTNYDFDYSGTTALLTSKTDPNNNVFLHQFDADGRAIQTRDDEGGVWNFFSARQGNNSAQYSYNTAETNTYQTLRTILDNGDVNKVTTLFDGTQLTDLNQADDLKQTLQSCAVTTIIDKVIDSKTKEPIPSQITITQPSGLQSITNIIKSYGEDGADTTKQTLTVDLNGKTSTVFSDSTTGVTTSTSAENRITTLNYDPATLLLQSSQTTGLFSTTYTYDLRGRQKTITRGARTTAYTYDAASKGDVTIITADDGKQTSFEYDALGRVSAIIYQDGSRTENTYDNNGNKTTLIIPTPATHGVTYNATNKVASETTPKDVIINEVTQYDYDKEGNLLQITLPSTKVISNTYTNGLLDFTTIPEGVIDYSYTCNEKISDITEGSESITYGYDGSLLTSISYSGALNQTIGQTYNTDFNIATLDYAGQVTSFAYDRDGLLTSTNGYTISRNAQNGLPEALSNGTLQQTRVFNSYGEAETANSKVSTKDTYKYTLGYNDLGKITTKTETLDDGTVNNYVYSYDDRRRLDMVTKNSILIEDYGYDANGNRILQTNPARGISNQSASYNLGDQLTSNGSTTYEYDADGYLSKKTTTAGITTYQYSSQGRLLQVQPPSKTISYQHNALGNRVAKLIDGVIIEKYLWLDKTTLLATYDKDDVLLQRYQYTDGNTPDSFTQGGQTYYIVTDHLGSPRVITSSSGAIVKKLDYDSFGNVLSDSNLGFSIPFGFAGGLQDSDTGLVRFGFRDYDADVGRWTARDPIGFNGGDTNLYGYTSNDPINFIDSDGLSRLRRNINMGRGSVIRDGPVLRPMPKPPKVDPAVRRFMDQRKVDFLNRMTPRDPLTLIENIDPRQENRRDLDNVLQDLLPDRRLDDEFMCPR